ncbi:phosphoribosyltransferase [Ramlibacter sp. XY19]|uniref:phosphoribosyltransferase n=1 Tax=Ramlibacter paludis TaxID=2908000 RepID=UPI0023DC116C|nr:phosphoribosyltransferase [Ramlibacter paludis]MCG2593933.1 phosphoribosyltransferase [Ramlibacter paludis]
MPNAPFTEATTAYWQELLPADRAPSPEPPWQYGYPAQLPDGRVLVLPIRALASEPTHAVASLILNQAALDVADALAGMLARALADRLKPDVLVGLPTLGLSLAAPVAKALGHARYLPMGYSRKFWYDEALSAPVQSITSPVAGKRIYLDPNLLPLLKGRRVVLVDDAVSTGTTLRAAWDLLEELGTDVVGAGVAMKQGRRWEDALGEERKGRVVGVFDSPLLQLGDDGWVLRT